jgi:sucrose-phosphate synthase
MNMYMIVGETGDTDYEQLLGGMHKIVIVKDLVRGSSEAKLQARGKYHRGESTLSDSPNILTAETSTCDSILDTLQKLGFKA